MIRRGLVVGALLLATAAVAAPAGRLRIRIANPKNGTVIPGSSTVTGTVSDSAAAVWVLSRARGVGGWTVQGNADVTGTNWSLPVDLAVPQDTSGGAAIIQIVALANPQVALSPGMAIVGSAQPERRSSVVTARVGSEPGSAQNAMREPDRRERAPADTARARGAKTTQRGGGRPERPARGGR